MRPWTKHALLAAIVLGAFVYGRLTARLPAPTDASIFWLGNLAAPYLLIPFLAGAVCLRAATASVAGGVAGALAVTGFYNLPQAWDYSAWFSTFVLGDPGGRPWLTIAFVAGLVFGYLGYRWRHERSRLAGAVVALAFVVEPLVHLSGAAKGVTGVRLTLHTSSVVIWAVEALVGAVALAYVWWSGRPDGLVTETG